MAERQQHQRVAVRLDEESATAVWTNPPAPNSDIIETTTTSILQQRLTTNPLSLLPDQRKR